MGYRLASCNGDSVAVPQLVFANLPRAGGDAVRVALYILSTQCTDAATIARALGLKSAATADRAMLWWAGVGLLEKERTGLAAKPPEKPEEEKTAELDFSALNDPNVAILCTEAQEALGKGIGRHDMQRLAGLYLNDGWQIDVILTCCAQMALQGRRTVAAVGRELAHWREEGVETGTDAEQYLRREAQRRDWCTEAAALFGVPETDFSAWDKRAIASWHEDWHFGRDFIAEALLYAEQHKTVRYVTGILRKWHAQGITTVEAVRGQGALTGSNILATGAGAASAAAPQAAANAIFDDETEW